MSEPIKKPGRRPEDYQPKEMPEIVKMARKAQTTNSAQSYTVKSENGGSYIDGIPMLRWGEWRDSSYCGCMTVLFEAIGIPASYEEIMGLSGVCWQMILRYDWDPSSEMPQNGKLCEKNVGDALGVSVYTLKNEKKIAERAKQSLNRGIPVLLVGGREAPEWELCCGYATEDGETRFFGRTYFDCQTNRTGEYKQAPFNEVYTDNQYFYKSNFPGLVPHSLTRFYDKRKKPISRKAALKSSLETCLMMFEIKSTKSHAFGYDAYDVLIEGFELCDAEYPAKCNCAEYHIGSMIDARHAAYLYLSMNEHIPSGRNQGKLAEVAQLYKSMADNLLGVVPYEETTPAFNMPVKATLWDTQRRQTLAKALQTNKVLEQQARVIVKDILTYWRTDR